MTLLERTTTSTADPMLQAIAALYGVGILAAFNPCSLPLYPAFLASWSAGGTRPARAAAKFVAGSASSFVVLGAAAGALGIALRVSQFIGRVSGVWLLIAGITTVVRQMQGRSGREWRPLEGGLGRHVARTHAGGLNPYLLGIGAGAGWSPCVGPLLGTALTAAGTTGSPVRSSILLAAYAIGTGTPLLVLANGLVRMTTLRSLSHRMAGASKVIAAGLMIAVGALLATGGYDDLIAWMGAGA